MSRLSSQQVAALELFAAADGPITLRGTDVSGRTIGSLQRLGLVEGVPPLGNQITLSGRVCLALESGDVSAIRAAHAGAAQS